METPQGRGEFTTFAISYGGYDGYHVFNDVAVLDTRTWTWTIKNTNAAVQGRADVSREKKLLIAFNAMVLAPIHSMIDLLTLAHR